MVSCDVLRLDTPSHTSLLLADALLAEESASGEGGDPEGRGEGGEGGRGGERREYDAA